jgi:predicted ATPase
MFLEKIEVRNYRSISALTLAPCGDFNVLIGRNSAGNLHP